MKFIYRPDGVAEADQQSWPFEPNKLLVPEVIEVERVTGMTYEEWIDAMQRTSATAVRAFLWVMLKRETPTLKVGQVVFSMSEVGFDYDDDEKRDLIRQLEERVRDEALSDEQLANVESTIADLRADLPPSDDDEQPAEQPKAEKQKPETAPKGSRSKSA